MPALTAQRQHPISTRVMVASGNARFRKAMLEVLMGARHTAVEALGGADALLKLEGERCAGLVLDRRLPDLDPDELAHLIAVQYPALEIEILDSATTRMNADAKDAGDFREMMAALRVPRPSAQPRREPVNTGEPRPQGRPQLRTVRLANESPTAAQTLLPGLVGHSAHLEDLSRLVRLVAGRQTTVLLLGETGTGKEMIAQGIHACSPRAERPWIAVNCAAIPEALMESELFGYQRGAFTGAMQPRTGRIVAAHTGTLFLDEIGELPLPLQAKLLRFLQEGELQRLGSNETQKVDVRIIAATNVDLRAAVEAGTFRRDLYYRLAVFPIELQPLRGRIEDVPPLARHFLSHLQGEGGRSEPMLSAEAAALLESHPWPGNVRELQHMLERAFILADGAAELRPEHFPALLSVAGAPVRFGPSRARG